MGWSNECEFMDWWIHPQFLRTDRGSSEAIRLGVASLSREKVGRSSFSFSIIALWKQRNGVSLG